MTDIAEWCASAGHPQLTRCACGAVQTTPNYDTGVTPHYDMGDTRSTRDKNLETLVVDEIVNQTTAREEQERIWLNQLTTPRGKIWTPTPAAAEEVISIAKELDPVEHLVHYRVRCYELDKRPNDREWVRWYRADQQKLRTEIRASSNSNEPEFRDDGTPSTWRNR